MAGTWQDIAYEVIPRANYWQRVNWHIQRLIEAKYPNPRKAPAAFADTAYWQAVHIVKIEDAPPELGMEPTEKGRYGS